MDLTGALETLSRAEDSRDQAVFGEAVEAVARYVADEVGKRKRVDVNGVEYVVEEVTWPVSQHEDGRSNFPDPIPKLSLVRDRAVLVDVREQYFDGNTYYQVVGDRVGRWRWFRSGSPGDRGYDLHLATDEDREAFAREASAVVETFTGGGLAAEGRSA